MTTQNNNTQAPAQQPVPQQPPNQQLSVNEKSISDSVLNRINKLQEIGEIQLPPNYSAANALKAAWLHILEVVDRNKKPALEVCTTTSVANALYEMVLKGLSVVKKQCYFVVYGNKLELEDSYIGKITVAKRDANVKEVNPVTVYQDDVFEFEIDFANGGRKKVTKHETKLENMDLTKIKGAYAIIVYNDGSTDTEIMTMAQIRKAWEQGAAGGNSPAHKNFPDQMCEKTVIGRALKIPAGSADDSALLPPRDKVSADVKHEINTSANKQELNIDDPNNANGSVPYAEEVKDNANNGTQQTAANSSNNATAQPVNNSASQLTADF